MDATRHAFVLKRCHKVKFQFIAAWRSPAMDGKELAHHGTQSAQEPAKRKAEEIPSLKTKKQARVAPAALVTLKNTRLSLRQKAVGWDRTMPVLRGTKGLQCLHVAVLAFQSFFAEHRSDVFTEMPPEHLSVIASLAQERYRITSRSY